VIGQDAGNPQINLARVTAASIEQDIYETAHNLGLPARRVEEGLYYLEKGQRALHTGDYPACIAANQRAIKSLGEWPPPLNNLSMALFFDGQPEKAIATARQVLAQDPNNVQALGNAIRFLAWTGQEAEARALWARLKDITPREHTERLKIAEAAAILDEDESVYQLLHPLAGPGAAHGDLPEFTTHEQFLLAVAEANTGRREAQRRLKALRDYRPYVGEYLAALKAGRPGPGWANRFPYFHSNDMIPGSAMQELVELVERRDKLSSQRFRSQVEHFASRFPQIVPAAEKLIWEENQPEAGVAILTTLATPAAYAALHRFGLSQVGEDDLRIDALLHLMQAGEIQQGATLRVWTRGKWQDLEMRQQEISDEPPRQYAPQVIDLLDQGTRASQQGDDQQAEQSFRRVLELEPRAPEAYNNLGALYARRGDHERAKEAFQAALEIDPTYAFPRCNLAIYLLDDDDVEGARAMLAPLTGKTRFQPQEMAFYSYTQARLAMLRKEYAAARRSLEVALKIWPGYDLAEELLERLDTITELGTGWEVFWERQHQRHLAARARLQAKLSTSAPTLPEALSLYSKDVLTGMGRVILPWGGWSGLRKAELLQRSVEGLSDPDNLRRMVTDLNDNERAALRQVLAHGGDMAWKEFDAAYGNDLEESPYWNWHVPETTMGRLRERGLLVEVTVDGELRIAVPAELRQKLQKILS
jgi:Flp pilus assembly protein TadD